MPERKQPPRPRFAGGGGEAGDGDLLAPQPLPEDSDPPARRREPAPMRALVEVALRRLNLPTQQLWQEELAAVWPQAVPPAAAAGLRPGKWERGVLYLYAVNSVRLFEIRRAHLRAIEENLRRHFGPDRLRQVRLMIDPGK